MDKKKSQELTLKRMECNESILKQLTDYIHTNPDIRFSQALLNLGIVQDGYHHCDQYWTDDYYLEPDKLIERMSKVLP